MGEGDTVWIELPLPVDIVAAMGHAILELWPDAVIDVDHGRGGQWLCVRRQRSAQAQPGEADG